VLVRHARAVLQQLERLRGELGQYARGLKSRVRLLGNTAALNEFLPEVLAAFLPRHRNIDIELEERPSEEIVRAVAEGRAEIGIAADTVDLAGVEAYPFRLDRLVLALPRGHALGSRRGIAFREVLGEDFVGLSSGSALQAHIDRHAARAGRRLKQRVRVGGFDALCRLVERGVGLAVLPETAARRCRRTMAIRFVRLTDDWALRNLKVCVRRLDALPRHARALVAALTEERFTTEAQRPREEKKGDS
jgi:DNA-binding transcriptional LysR family regulator